MFNKYLLENWTEPIRSYPYKHASIDKVLPFKSLPHNNMKQCERRRWPCRDLDVGSTSDSDLPINLCRMKEQWHYIGINSASILKNWVTKKKFFHCVLSVKSKKCEATYWGLAFYNSNNTIKLKLVKSYKLI